MKGLLALLLAPSTALTAQGVMFALVTPSCADQSRFGLHASAAVALLVTLVLAWLAWGEAVPRRAGTTADSDEASARRRFVAVAGVAVALLSSLVVLAMWFGVWVLSPCAPLP